jgi:hypothetical protein
MKAESAILIACVLSADPAIAAGMTFFSTSDIHYGWSGSDRGGDRDSLRAVMPGLINSLPGTAYPNSAETVAIPRGVLVPGDLIHWEDTTLWRRFNADYAVAGTGKLKFPIYDGTGNHELQDARNIIGPLYLKRNAERKGRYGLTDMDSIGYHYSWDWEGVHFVNLNLCPGTAETPDFWNGPANSIRFLEADLAKHVGGSGRPVFLMHHFPYNDTGYTPDYDQGWVTSARDRLFSVLKGYNCIGIVHGHTHFYPSAYRYRGVDIFDDGANMSGDYLVFRIADGKLKANNRSKDKWGSMRFQKDISMGDPTPIRSGMPGSVQFRFSVAGKGILYSGYEPVASIGLFGMDGRRLLEIRVTSPDAVWNGLDAAGRSVRKGVYLARFKGKGGIRHLRFLVD